MAAQSLGATAPVIPLFNRPRRSQARALSKASVDKGEIATLLDLAYRYQERQLEGVAAITMESDGECYLRALGTANAGTADEQCLSPRMAHAVLLGAAIYLPDLGPGRTECIRDEIYRLADLVLERARPHLVAVK